MTAMLMSGYNRTYQPPFNVRERAHEAFAVTHDSLAKRVALGNCTAWDLLKLSHRTDIGGAGWVNHTIDTVLAAARPGIELCLECPDTGYYAIEDGPDRLVGLVRELDGEGERLLADGCWEPYDTHSSALRVLDTELAQDLAETIVAGAEALVLRYTWPVAWIEPCCVLTAAVDMTKEVEPAKPSSETDETDSGWSMYAVVDPLDPGAVLNVIRISPGPKLERYEGNGEWVEDSETLADLRGISPAPLVELKDDTLSDVLEQIDKNSLDEKTVTAAVSADPRAEKLRRYWSTGKGAAKIRWGTKGDWTRCYRYLKKYMGVRAKGYCQNLHKRNTGVWTGSRLNASVPPAASIETALMASLEAGLWTGEDGRIDRMSTLIGIRDGIYTERLDNIELLKTIVAGGFPVAPPDEWFGDPKLDGPTPLTVDDDGHVYGHIATFDVAHIGLPGKVHAPKSRTDYAYFKTGALRVASGKDVNVGQLTLAGGHAPLAANAGAAVAHYDQTASAVADINVGEDRYGIWAAGALRPDVKPEQVRTLRASAPSGDWRPIGGSLELVAICQVNVPGFPVTRARVASGAITALVAAGTRPLMERRLTLMADALMADRVAALEEAVFAASATAAVEVPTEAVDAQTVEEIDSIPVASDEAVEEDNPITRARNAVKERRRQALRDKVHGTAETASGGQGKA